MSTTETSSSTTRAHRARRVLDGEPGARLERALAHPADSRGRARARRSAGASGSASMSPRPTSTSSSSRIVTDMRRDAASSDRRRSRPRDARAPARRQHDHLVAGAPDAACDLARVAAVVVVLVRHRADHPLHGKRRSSRLRSPASSTVSRCSSSVGPVVPGHRSPRSTTLSPRSADIGIAARRARPSRRASAGARARSRGTAPPRSRRGPSC